VLSDDVGWEQSRVLYFPLHQLQSVYYTLVSFQIDVCAFRISSVYNSAYLQLHTGPWACHCLMPVTVYTPSVGHAIATPTPSYDAA